MRESHSAAAAGDRLTETAHQKTGTGNRGTGTAGAPLHPHRQTCVRRPAVGGAVPASRRPRVQWPRPLRQFRGLQAAGVTCRSPRGSRGSRAGRCRASSSQQRSRRRRPVTAGSAASDPKSKAGWAAVPFCRHWLRCICSLFSFPWPRCNSWMLSLTTVGARKT